jgi:hypothetical protein
MNPNRRKYLRFSVTAHPQRGNFDSCREFRFHEYSTPPNSWSTRRNTSSRPGGPADALSRQRSGLCRPQQAGLGIRLHPTAIASGNPGIVDRASCCQAKSRPTRLLRADFAATQACRLDGRRATAPLEASCGVQLAKKGSRLLGDGGRGRSRDHALLREPTNNAPGSGSFVLNETHKTRPRFNDLVEVAEDQVRLRSSQACA